MSIVMNGFAAAAIAAPQGPGKTVVENAGERLITLTEYENGVSHLELAGSPIRKLILSGGGGKGVAYPGAVSALDSLGILPGIESVHGSSIGAIMAAVIAAGMEVAKLDSLIDDTDLLSLLDSQDANLSWLQRGLTQLGEHIEAHLPTAIGSYTRLLLSVLPRIQSGAQPLQDMIRNEVRSAVLARIVDLQVPAVSAVRERLLGGEAVTFADLALLSRHTPWIKNLYITGTAMFPGGPQLVIFSAALTPELDVALAAHISASLPVVFHQPSLAGLNFQVLDELTHFQDGAVLLNTPVPQLVNPGQATDLLSGSDMLILVFEQAPQSRIHKPIDWLADLLAGTPVSAQRQWQNLQLKTFEAQTVTVPLRSERGDFSGELNGTLNFTLSKEIRDHLQEGLEQAVRAHLAQRTMRRERYEFASLQEALLSLDDGMLDSVAAAIEHLPEREVLAWRRAARQLLDALQASVEAAGPDSPVTRNSLDQLDSLGRSTAHVQWLVMALNHHERPALNRLLNALDEQSVTSPVLAAALDEKRRREIRVIAGNIRKSLIFPALHLPFQSRANSDLLREVDQLLMQATQSAQVNQALDRIISEYRSVAVVSRPLGIMQTVELAKDWRLDEGAR
ncbi:patatin-like phospholipase family protein [Pseudomonas sp. 21LCFQ02]|uniref:patatin-like phospholipase family protein n=1 Tax=Pseudomonas sp. 21LCFQ02 TaxID=2957505 RepID=UPI00209AFBD7|nr:patatin-like phospholipase family protein [Pseudomonas sp. 21LCFQ02]MCO8171571.1 patatin-like phospholipase family protein [Pseudomonas sp. 21LCFQ02]